MRNEFLHIPVGVRINFHMSGAKVFVSHRAHHAPRTHLVRLQGINPVVEIMIALLQVSRCTTAGTLYIHALINRIINPHAHFHSGKIFKLPETNRIGRRNSIRNQCAFLNRQVFEINRKAFFSKYFFYDREIGLGALCFY